MLLAGGFTLCIASWFDFLGLVFGSWHYSGRVLPTIPSFFPWDFSLIPVTIMLWLQFKPTINPFIKAVIYSVLTSFIGEPLFEWIGLYTMLKWNVFYSFLIWIVIYLIAYRISKVKAFDPL
ncbi:CBO0543 family protein [Bacillus sp. OV166]|uniref:CBO0543 family protein n=1 Tax=Bacillus sp. OV166 TaxID=1882763 RepID=UPI000B44D5C5|nr:CBO0543 family protein [Bacillus sp. OV166]